MRTIKLHQLIGFVVLVLFTVSVSAQNDGSSCARALKLYPAPSGDCNNASGPQFAGQYQCESGDCANYNMTATVGIDGTCTTDNDASQLGTWIQVTATANNFTITNQTAYSGGGAATVERKDYVVFSGTCGALTQIGCFAEVNNGSSNTVSGLTVGTTYYIWVTRSASSIGTGNTTANGAATCITSTVAFAPPGNGCSVAIPLTTNVTIASTNANAIANGPICSGSVENNVWYLWCAPASWPVGQTAFINVNNQICNSTSGLQLTVWNTNSSCPTISTDPDVVCQNPGATTNYFYTWTAVANTCYYITIDGFAATSCSFDITVGTTAIAACTITGNTNICIGGTSQLTGSGTPAATNPWVSSNTAVATVSATGLVTSVSAGTSTITYTTSTGCTATATVTINALPTITGTPSTCIGQTTQLTGSGTAAASNPWASSNTAVATVSTTGLVSGVGAGSAVITYTNSVGCSMTQNVTINPLPTISGTLSVCAGATSQLTGSATAAATNPWISSNTSVATISNTGLVSAISGGTTIITYTNSNGCFQTATFTVNALPTITGTMAICVGQTSVLTGSPTAAAANPWVSSNTGVATISNSGLVTAISAGTSTITYTNSNGCSQTAVVTINPLPSFNVTGNDPSTCNGTDGSVVLSSLNASTAYNLTYFDDGVQVGPNSVTSSAGGTITIGGLNAGTYDNITISIISSGCSTTNAPGVSLSNPGAPNVFDIANQNLCDVGFTLPTITGTGLSGNQAYYTGSNGTGTMLPVGTIINNPGVSTLIFIYDVNGVCTDQENFTVLVNNTPSITNPGSQTACDVFNLPIITGTNLSGSQSYYSDSQINGGVPITGTITTSQTVFIYDANGICTDEKSFLVTINNTPAITNPTAQTACDSYNLPVINGTNLSGSQNYYSNSQANGGTVIAGPITTSQTVYIFDTNGSCSDEESFSIMINSTPSITNPGNQISCGSYNLGTITGTNLSGNEAYYNNAQGSGGVLISGPINTTQTVFIYDTNGACSDEESFVVTILNSPIISNPGAVSACDSYTLPIITGSNLTGTEAYYNDLQSNGGTVITGSITTSQTVYMYDSNGTCSDEEPLIITITPTPALVITNPTAVCSPATVDITSASVTAGSTGGGTLSYFTDPAGTIMLTSPTTVGSSGIYYIQSNSNGCSDIEAVSVTINPLDISTFTVSDYCAGEANTANVTGTTGGVFSFNPAVTDGATINSTTGAISSGVGGTSYTIAYTTSGVCPASSTQNVLVKAIPSAPTLSADVTYCSAQTKAPITATGSSILWYNDAALTNNIASGNSLLPTNQSTTVFYATQTVNGCESPSNSTTITVETCNVTIPTAFTPDADGTNDSWILNEIDLNFPKNTVQIFNRWGAKLFVSEEGKYSASPWDGTYKGEKMPVGSYYFMIEYNDGSTETTKGTVSIILLNN